MLARSEAALRPPVEALSRRYGEGLAVEPPAVRTPRGASLLRLLGLHEHLDAHFDRSVDVGLWLSRYCPITDDGSHAA